jgi:CO/xanthine dehydrogenase FAD-binding subunit
MAGLTFKTPADLDQLVSCLAVADADTWLLGGGTDLVIRLRDRGITRGTLIDLTGVAGLDRIEADADWIGLGANVTYAQVADHPLVAAELPALAQMASQVGSTQIRNMARLPGNLANASPAGDAIANLMALEARVDVLDGRGETATRTVAEVVTGIGRTTLARDQAIVRIRVPRPGPGRRSAYGKLGLAARREVVIANVSLTLVVDFDPDRQVIRDARAVLGSAAPLAYHATRAEALLRGRRPGPALALELAEALRAHVEVSINGIEMFKHKLQDVQGLALDLFNRLFADELGA